MFALPISPSEKQNPTMEKPTTPEMTQKIKENTIILEKQQNLILPSTMNLNESFFPPISQVKPCRNLSPKKVRLQYHQEAARKLKKKPGIIRKIDQNSSESPSLSIQTIKILEKEQEKGNVSLKGHEMYQKTMKSIIPKQKERRSRSLQQSFCEYEEPIVQQGIPNCSLNIFGQTKNAEQVKKINLEFQDHGNRDKSNSSQMANTRFTFASRSNLELDNAHLLSSVDKNDAQKLDSLQILHKNTLEFKDLSKNQSLTQNVNSDMTSSQVSSISNNNLPSQPRRNPFLSKSILQAAQQLNTLKDKSIIHFKRKEQNIKNRYDNRRIIYQNSFQDQENCSYNSVNNSFTSINNNSLLITAALSNNSAINNNNHNNTIDKSETPRNLSATFRKQNPQQMFDLSYDEGIKISRLKEVIQQQKEVRNDKPLSNQQNLPSKDNLGLKGNKQNIRSALTPKCLNSSYNYDLLQYQQHQVPEKLSPIGIHKGSIQEKQNLKEQNLFEVSPKMNQKDTLFLHLVEDLSLMKFSDQNAALSRRAIHTHITQNKENTQLIVAPPRQKQQQKKKSHDFSSQFEQSYGFGLPADASLPTRQDTQFSSQPSTPKAISTKYKSAILSSAEANRIIAWRQL